MAGNIVVVMLKYLVVKSHTNHGLNPPPSFTGRKRECDKGKHALGRRLTRFYARSELTRRNNITKVFQGEKSDSRAVVLNLGSIEPQGFGESVSGVRRFGLPHL